MFQEFYVTVANCHRKFIWNFPEISSTFVSHGISGGKLGDGNSEEKGLGRKVYRRLKGRGGGGGGTRPQGGEKRQK